MRVIQMAYGYEKCFVVEHDDTIRKRITCKDCVNYDREDNSCVKRPVYFPDDGYRLWRKCKYFELYDDVPNYEHKFNQYYYNSSVPPQSDDQGPKHILIKKIDRFKNFVKFDDGYELIVSDKTKFSKWVSVEFKTIRLNKKKMVFMINVDSKSKKIYVDVSAYSADAINALYKALRKEHRSQR